MIVGSKKNLHGFWGVDTWKEKSRCAAAETVAMESTHGSRR